MVPIKSNNFSKKTVVANGLTISYLVTDYREGTPWILLHGTRDTKEIWKGFFDRFGNDHYLIALDLRGHGETDQPDMQYSFDLFVDDIRLFCETLKLTKIAVLGHSMGGGLSMYLAIKYPDLVTKLVLMGCSPSHRLDFKPDTEGKTIPEIIQLMTPFFFPRERKIVPLSVVQEVERKITHGWAVNSKPHIHLHKRLNELRRVDLSGQIQDIKAPTLIIFGELDAVAKLEDGTALLQKIPNSTLKVVEDAGHFMFLERPEVVYDMVADSFKA